MFASSLLVAVDQPSMTTKLYCGASPALFNASDAKKHVVLHWELGNDRDDESSDDERLAATPSPVPSLLSSDVEMSPVSKESPALVVERRPSSAHAALDLSVFTAVLGAERASSESAFPYALLVEQADESWARFHTSLDGVAMTYDPTTWPEPRIDAVYTCETFDLRTDEDCYGAVDVAFRHTDANLLRELYALAIEAPTPDDTDAATARLNDAVAALLDEYPFYAADARAELEAVVTVYQELEDCNVTPCLERVAQLIVYIDEHVLVGDK